MANAKEVEEEEVSVNGYYFPTVSECLRMLFFRNSINFKTTLVGEFPDINNMGSIFQIRLGKNRRDFEVEEPDGTYSVPKGTLAWVTTPDGEPLKPRT